MKPITKAHSIAFSFATAIVYALWGTLSSVQPNSMIASLIITFVLSLTFYRAVFELLLFMSKHILFIKKLILGKYFFEGVWIGFYIVNDEVEYYYEIIEQTFDETTIKGIAFGEDQKSIGEWTISNPNIDISESKLTYYYEMNDISADDITLGHSRATIYWKHGHAFRLFGFAIDNFSAQKQCYTTVKVKTPKNLQEWISNNFWEAVKKLYDDEK
ncbi:hypothetical protein [Bacteroides caecimuris]|jgi:hypothetical protein|uniref:hypothetical protein n=1 Tax=Bacteroides caecimuris TaxID=1796613 RepID=UPI00257260D5|nr:hypothetical protein [Bacteroides caecimuris]